MIHCYRTHYFVVTSVSHGVWNGLADAMFGFGEKTGGWGIQDTWLFGPEVGLLGIVLNGAVAFDLWCLAKN